MLLAADYLELKTIHGYIKIYMYTGINVYIYIYVVCGSEYTRIQGYQLNYIHIYIKSSDIRNWLM